MPSLGIWPQDVLKAGQAACYMMTHAVALAPADEAQRRGL
jgi:hypothetical protein